MLLLDYLQLLFYIGFSAIFEDKWNDIVLKELDQSQRLRLNCGSVMRFFLGIMYWKEGRVCGKEVVS
jgi:hypothetical protein